MTQHSIDLLPPSIRARSRAGLRTGRFIIAATASIMIMMVFAVHSMVALATAQEHLFQTSVRA
jgi:hypothetical protein